MPESAAEQKRKRDQTMGNKGWSAKDLYDEKAIEALSASERPAFAKAAEQAREGMEKSTRIAAALFYLGGASEKEAIERALNPDAAAYLSVPPEIPLRRMFDCFGNAEAEALETRMLVIDRLLRGGEGVFALWAFPDGSALATLQRWSAERAVKALREGGYDLSEELVGELGSLWPAAQGPYGAEIGRRVLAVEGMDGALFPMGPKEAKAFARNALRPDWGWGREEKRKIEFREMKSGSEIGADDLSRAAEKALDRRKSAIHEKALAYMERSRRERETEERANWREALCLFMRLEKGRAAQENWRQMPYDAGFAAFLMERPTSFTQKTAPMWKKAYEQVCSIVGMLPDGESPTIAQLSAAASQLGTDMGSQLSHFLYRYYRAGGPKALAKRVFEQTREKVVEDMKEKTGLAAIIRKKDEPVSAEAREAGKAASSVEFSVQYGAALALHAALWGKETDFEEMQVLAKSFIRAMRGASEISMECFGWLSCLVSEFAEGAIEKEQLVAVILESMETASQEAEKAKVKGGKITIENEWSGRWSHELAKRKIQEYLEIGNEKDVALNLGPEKSAEEPKAGASRSAAEAPAAKGLEPQKTYPDRKEAPLEEKAQEPKLESKKAEPDPKQAPVPESGGDVTEELRAALLSLETSRVGYEKAKETGSASETENGKGKEQG